MGKNKNRRGFSPTNFWESDAYNQFAYQNNIDTLLALAMNRFRWVGLPDTCDERFLEKQLHKTGMATICHPQEMPDMWQTLIAMPFGEFNAYGIPTQWRAKGWEMRTEYEVTPDNGELVYYSRSRVNPWNGLAMFALKMTHYQRTEDINLSHQHKPWILIAPQEKRQELMNFYKQVSGYEPAILGDRGTLDLAQSVTTIPTEVPFIGEDLARAYQNVLNNALMYLGIPHLAFEKGERMIEDEARANTAPTNIMLLNCLSARRDAAKALNRRFGLNIEVYFNDDWESYNFNYVNNIESMAQDGVLEGRNDGEIE